MLMSNIFRGKLITENFWNERNVTIYDIIKFYKKYNDNFRLRETIINAQDLR